MTDYREYITIEPGKRSGKACVRGMRITVQDVLSYLATGMSHKEIIDDFPELTQKRYSCLPGVRSIIAKSIYWELIAVYRSITSSISLLPHLSKLIKLTSM